MNEPSKNDQVPPGISQIDKSPTSNHLKSVSDKKNFVKSVESRIDLNQLFILKYYKAQERILSAYDYFGGIFQLISTSFNLKDNEITIEQYELLYNMLMKYCEHMKNTHHSILVKILSYLPLNSLISKISLLNRKLYIVSGDIQLL